MIIKDILDFQANDNFVVSFSYCENLSIVIETWDNCKYRVEFFECFKMELNTGVEFEIGSISLISGKNFNSGWEKAFIDENGDYKDYSEVVFCDAWQIERINFRAIFKYYKITKI